MKKFERVTPEQVGVSSKAVLQLLDELESGSTEPHGIIIMRHGKICAEGAWKPYALGINHGMQSFTKTYSATAIGIAYRMGLLSLDEKLTDIFPGKGQQQPFTDQLTVCNLLRMGTGMQSLPGFDGDWVDNFLRHPIEKQPGSAFFYNSVGSTMLGAIIRQKTGKTLHEFLSACLFPKIGIHADHLGWMRLPDGMEIGGSGLFATLEDNLRLMKLYLDGGVCDGERILSEEYVKLATSKQIGNGPGPSPEASSGMGSRCGCVHGRAVSVPTAQWVSMGLSHLKRTWSSSSIRRWTVHRQTPSCRIFTTCWTMASTVTPAPKLTRVRLKDGCPACRLPRRITAHMATKTASAAAGRSPMVVSTWGW